MRLKQFVHSLWEGFQRLQAHGAEQRVLRMHLRQLRAVVPFRAAQAVAVSRVDTGWIHRQRPGVGAASLRRCG